MLKRRLALGIFILSGVNAALAIAETDVDPSLPRPAFSGSDPLDVVAATTQTVIETTARKKPAKLEHPNWLSGTCQMQSMPGGPEFPCQAVMLVLEDPQGNVLDRGRTDDAGRFTFVVSPGKSYLVAPQSGLYSAELEPSGLVNAGVKPIVHLSPRN